MSSPSLVMVLLEDDHHRRLISRYLTKHGLKQRQIRFRQSPSGAADNWVRKTFIEETNAYRGRQVRAKTALIVVIDADTFTVQDRLAQLDQALKDNGKRGVDTKAEQIARLVPRRNIETWILCLNGQTVDEIIDYKKKNDWDKLIPPAAEALFQWSRSEAALPNHCTASLRSGIGELSHLEL